MRNNSRKLMIDRRRFLQYSASIGGYVSLSPVISPHFYSLNHELPADIQWYSKPLRILQTVLREPDAAEYDAQSVVGYMELTGCNTLVVNGGGIVDFFQNPLPAANINTFMASRDILGEITEACHKAGIRVIARIDFRGVEEKIYKQYPDWFSREEDQKPKMLTYTRPQLYAACYNGHYRNEHAKEFISYIMKSYDLDGIWHNSVGVGGICYCSRCRDSYRAATGEEIPSVNASDAKLDRYMSWKTVMADRHMGTMRETVKSFGEDKVYTAEVFSMFEAGARINDGIDLYNARDHFDFLVSVAFLTENSEIIHYADLNYSGTIIRFLKSMAPEKEAIILYGGNGTSHRYITDPENDLRVWLWEALAAGGRFWNCSFTGMHPGATYDRRSAYHQSDTYLFVKENEKFLTRQVPVASIGIYYSKATRLSFRNRSVEGDQFGSFIRGIEKVLTENHIPYDFIADDQVSETKLKKYNTIILPGVRCLSGKELDLIGKFVSEGGNLIATYESSLYDEKGTQRRDFGLAELFGCHYTGKKTDTRKDCYQYISDKDHPLVKADSEKTELLINAGFTLLCTPEARSRVICTYVPIVHNQPPEKAWTTKWAKEFPTIIENRYGKGKVIYFANQPDVISSEMGHPDMRNLLLRSMRYLAGDSIQIETNAPESVHAGLTRSADSPGEYVFSLVNTTSGAVRPIRSIVPVHDIHVTLTLGSNPESFKILRPGGSVKVEFINGKVEILIDKLKDFFSVYLKTT